MNGHRPVVGYLVRLGRDHPPHTRDRTMTNSREQSPSIGGSGGATAAASRGLSTLAINNIAMSVADIERSVAWYRDVLGFKLASRTQFPPVSAEVAFMSKPGFSIELLQVPDNYPIQDLLVAPPAHLRPRGFKAMVFDVDDLAEASAELELAKVTIVWKQQVIDPSTGLTSTLIRDPDGNLINLFQKQR